MYKLILAILQRFSPQRLRRKPEMDAIMMDEEADRQFTLDGEKGSLAILYDMVVNILLKITRPSGEALDICCGSAQLLCKIARAMPGMHFTGIDLSRSMLEYGKKSRSRYQTPNVDFRIADMYKLTETFDRPFDLITWNLAMHHCDDEENVLCVLGQCAKLLKHDGCLFIFDINRPKTGRLALQFADLYNNRWGDWFFQDSLDSYKAAFTYDEVEAILKQSDLKGIMHCKPVIGDFFQLILQSPLRNQNAKHICNLRKIRQKIDYLLLSSFLYPELKRHGI